MNKENEFKVRLNQYGQPDIDYYMANARRLRDEAISSWFSSLKSKLSKRWHERRPAAAARRPAIEA